MVRISNKKFIILLALLLIVVFVVIFATSYAFFNTTVTSKEFIVYTGSLAVDYKKKTDVININNLYPMTNSQGLELTPHEFIIENTGNIDARYQIRLELAEDNMIPIEYIKMSFKENDGEYSEPVLLSDLNSSLVFLSNKIINPTNSNSYGIKLWIDLSAPNDIQGKIFKARIVVDSIQNVEDGYQIDTVPIITLNKTNEGTVDINLEVNEEYKELGVLKVEDDQDILTPNQVIKTYEYYDGENLTTVDSIDTSKIGIYYITYSITDKNNNTGKTSRVVTVNNTKTIPTITLNGDSNITLGEYDDYIEKGVTIEDNNKVTILGEVKTSTIGTYIVRYIVVDKNNNLNSVTRTVIVNEAYKEEILNGADPVLTQNLVPVQISNTGIVTKASTLSTWYDYETKNWANAVVLRDDEAVYENGTIIEEDDIESYFVWIPRYSYQLFAPENYNSLFLEKPTTSIASTINIKFESKSNIISDSSDGWLTHPAFLAFDTNGLWVGKFETGYNGATTITTAEVNSIDLSKIVIKPNVYSWRNISPFNIFNLSLDYLKSSNSHMMKNTEWGAVAYLSQSKYGINDEININNNSNYLTGYSSTDSADQSSVPGTYGTANDITVPYNTLTGFNASTTGNISGIYDMSGGAHEFMASYRNNSIDDTSFTTQILSTYNKYFDVYDGNSNIETFNNRILGDATGEIGPFYNYLENDNQKYSHSNWYGDFSYFVGPSTPWFLRGGGYDIGVLAGIFNFNGYLDTANSVAGFRIVLAPTK